MKMVAHYILIGGLNLFRNQITHLVLTLSKQCTLPTG